MISNLACTPVAGGRPDQVSCAPVDVTVAASNVTLAVKKASESADHDSDTDSVPPANPFVSPVYGKPGVQPNTPGCGKLSQNTSFEVTNFLWSATGVTFSLTNNGLNYTQPCSLRVSDSRSTQSWWNCTSFDAGHASYPPYQVFTSVLYGGPQNVLGVNQTWYCNDADSKS